MIIYYYYIQLSGIHRKKSGKMEREADIQKIIAAMSGEEIFKCVPNRAGYTGLKKQHKNLFYNKKSKVGRAGELLIT